MTTARAHLHPWTAALLLLFAAACRTAPPVAAPADRRSGPENAAECPGARWTGPTTIYDLESAPAVLPVEPAAAPGERVVAVFHRTGFSDRPVEASVEWSADGAAWTAIPERTSTAGILECESSDTGTNGELNDSARDCVGAKQVRLGWKVPPGEPRRVRVVLRAAGPGRKAVGRARVQIVPGTCRALDACWRASGNNCDGAPLSNCAEDEQGMLTCPTSVGSQAHDSCCSRWGAGGYICGRCGNLVSDRADLAGCLVTDPPAGLEPRFTSSPSGDFPGGYVPCRAEWDMAFRDVAAVPSHLWSFAYDPLEITHRPTEVTRLVSVRGKPAVAPLPGAYLYPAGAHLRAVDAEQGWCASGRWSQAAAGVARCE